MDNLEPITRNEMFLNGDDLEPITREEMILAGADLEPLTRHEWFLKKYRGGGGGGGYNLVNIPDLPADIASFNDGTDLPMASLKVAVTPYQDLHGYDGPWAGGAGKNKLNLADITVASGGFVYNREPINVVVNTYTLSFNFTGSSGSISISLRNGETVVSTIQDIPLVNGLNTFTMPTLSDNADSISLYASRGGTYENFMLEIGSQATTYAPYSNICPISGWDEAVVTVADDAESPTTSHEYTIDLDGTRYGGTLDVVSGVLTVDKGYVDLGTLSWNKDSGRFVAQLPNDSQTYVYNSDLSDLISDIWTPKVRNAGWNDMTDGQYGIAERQLRIKYSIIETKEAFATFVNGSIFVYPLATPITVQLTPTAVKSLEGENNIFANCGQITEVKYFKKA